MSASPRLLVEGVHRSFGPTEVLRAIDLQVRAGEVLGLIGPNGGGKSTLILLMAGLLRPSQGRITVEGTLAVDLARKASGEIGLITPDPGLYPLLTGHENLRFFGELNGLSPSDVDDRARPWIETLGLEAALHTRTGTWSSGMRQKLSLVRARLCDPLVLLFDEPTANLDPIAADAVWRAVHGAAEAQIAVVVATHDLRAAETICDRVAFVQSEVRHLETLQGERAPPSPSRLLEVYRRCALEAP
ncbi:MAG: ABC transporter ATP-binding protein [Deltaproteobacteria bacterium]|nr:MAG: ABC transporter ATP-binding protein [Deltaproteobacteria bacterium]